MTKSKKKVLLVVRKPVGGIRTFLRYVYRKFDPEHWFFTILAPEIPEMRVLIDDLSTVDVNYVPTGENPSPVSFSWQITKELLKGKYDLVHSHGFTSGVCAAIPAMLSRTNHIMTSHDVINETQFVGIKGKVKKTMMNRLFNLIGTIHSVSQDAQDNLLQNFPGLAQKKGKCFVIPNGIDVERFVEAVPRDLRGELGLDDKTFLIGFFGRFMSQKGFRYLVDAIDLLRKDKSLIKHPMVLTFGYGGFVREERQAIKERSLESHFYYMPFESNVAGAIKGLDVVAMPSLWEACGLLSMEVLSCGTPLIASNCIGLREVTIGTPTIVIPMKNSTALAQALRNEMEVSTKHIFTAFQKTAINKFDVSTMTDKLHQVYDRMLRTRK